jgi:lysophospholipase L1-like esterase
MGSIGLLVGAGEVVLRTLEGRSDDTPLFTSTPDPFISRLEPGVTAWRSGVEIRTNAIGARGEEVSPVKPPGITRIACVGDSYLFGTGVEQTDTLPARLERELEGVETINLGIEGANAYDHRVRIEHIALPLDPDIVIVFFLFNDVYLMERGLDWMAARQAGVTAREGARRAHERWQNRSYVWRYLAPRLAGVARSVLGREAGRLAVWDRQFEDDVPAWRVSRDALLQARDLCEARGVQFAMAVLPSFAVFRDGKYPLSTYRQRVVAWCEEEGIPVVDLHEPFWGEVGRRYWINPLDPHPDGEACAKMAAHVAEWIRSDDRLGVGGTE